jgi:tripartite-type tricarboxylate transporter receptor subunit TctC
MINRWSLVGLAFGAALVGIAAEHAIAQSFPSKPVHGIVAFGVGGQTDAAARVLGAKLSERWNQQVIIENRPGAAGNIGTEAVAKAAPDGYTLNFATQTVTINRVLMPSAAFDPMKDLAPVSLIGLSDFVLVVHPSLPVKTVQELIDYAKANPGKLNYGATSFQGAFAMEQMNSLAGIHIERVPYTAMSSLQSDLLAGRINVYFTPPRPVLGHIESGKLRPIAVSGAKPIPVLPGVPSIKTVLPKLEASTWYGVLAPAGTPQDIIAKLNTDLRWALEQPDVRDRLEKLSIEPRASTPAELNATMRRDVEVVEDLVRRGVMKPGN